MSKILKRVISVILCITVMMSVYAGFGITSVSAASLRDTSDGQWVSNVKVASSGSYAPDGSSYSTNVYEIDGSVAYCLEPAKKSPAGNSVKLKFCEVGSANLKKAMYYYSGGGKNSKVFSYNGTKCTLNEYIDKTASYYWFKGSGTKFLLIHYACAKLYGSSDWSYGLATNDWIKAVTSVANVISGAPNAPSDFVCYLAQTVDTSIQTLLFIPSNSVTITKLDAITKKKLSGATFRIDWYENDSRYVPRYTKTTGSDGVVSFSNLPPGKYRVTETTAPKGYAKAAVQYFTVSGSGGTGSVSNGNLTFYDNQYIKLQLLKSSANTSITDNNSCYSLEGAVYNIYTNSNCTGTAVGSIKTDANGYGCFGSGSDKNTSTKDKSTSFYSKNSGKSLELKSGVTYYCKEVTSPKGYELDKTVYKFTDSGATSSDNIKIYRAVSTKDNKSMPKDNPVNDPVGIVLQKRNSVTGETVNQGLEGAIFQIQYFSEVIDKDCDVTSKDVNPTLNSSTLKRTWYIKTDTDGYTILTNDTNYFVDNITYNSDDLYFDGSVVTIPIGTIVIKEVQAPEGYTISDTVFYRRISEEIAIIAKDTNTPLEVPIDETPAVGYIGVNKRNNSGSNVAGAEYGLYDDESCSTAVATVVTTKDGHDIFLFDGELFKASIGKTYYIKEISAPVGYKLDTTVYPVTPTTENATIETALMQDVYEDSEKGNIIIKKSSNDGVIKNLWFAVTDNLGNEYNAVCTNSNGIATVTGLPVYDVDGSKIQYTVKELGFKAVLGRQSYGGYTWVVRAANCVNYKGSYYEGMVSYSRYLYGDVDGAFANFEDGYTKELTTNKTVTYSFVNTAPTVEILIQKKSYDGIKQGFWFRVEDKFGNSYGEVCTDSKGEARLTDENATRQLLSCLVIPYSAQSIPMSYRIVELGFKDPGTGEYYLPERYKEAYTSEFFSTEVVQSHQIMDFDAYNEPDTGSIKIEKSSDDGVISNLSFRVSSFNESEQTAMGYDESGNPVYSIVMTTNGDGYATSNDVTLYDVNGKKMNGPAVYAFGSIDDEITYEITELGFDNGDGTYTLPSRYIKNDPVRYNLLENRNVVFECHNTVKTAKLQVLKTSDDGIVDEIWFNIKCSEADIDVNVVTDSSGYSEIIENLPIYQNGSDVLLSYTITELGIDEGNGNYSIPSRYTAPKAKKITLDKNADNNVIFAAMHNTLKNGSIALNKQDENGNSLSGSVWELHKADGSIVYLIQNGSGKYFVSENGTITELSTNPSGQLFITDLPQGDYYFIEVKAPNGFMSYGDKVNFTISPNDGETLNKKLNVKDSKIVMYDTGGVGNAPIYAAGFAFAAISLAFIVISFVNARKRHSVK